MFLHMHTICEFTIYTPYNQINIYIYIYLNLKVDIQHDIHVDICDLDQGDACLPEFPRAGHEAAGPHAAARRGAGHDQLQHLDAQRLSFSVASACFGTPLL